MRFRDRSEAGRRLADALVELDLDSPIVLALPRGGVPVAFEVAEVLEAPLDVFVSRKIGAPGQPEFGIGAIAEGGQVVVNQQAVEMLGVSETTFQRLIASERGELARRVQHYRGDRELPDLQAHDVVLVDDGLATGVTAEAALRALWRTGDHRLVLAVPVCAPQTAGRLRSLADEVICVDQPSEFRAVGEFYRHFDQTSDDEVLALLARSAHRMEAVK